MCSNTPIRMPILVDKEGCLYIKSDDGVVQMIMGSKIPEEKLLELKKLDELELMIDYGGLDVDNKTFFIEEKGYPGHIIEREID